MVSTERSNKPPSLVELMQELEGHAHPCIGQDVGDYDRVSVS